MERDESGRVRPSEREARLVQVMADLAAGDGAAVFTLVERFRPELAHTVRRIAGDRHVELWPDEVDELVIDAALAIQSVAKGWDPAGGAKPWTWAWRRIANAVDRHLGQWAESLDDGGSEANTLADQAAGPAAPGQEAPVLDLVGRVAATEPVVALLREAVYRVASPTDREIFFETTLQASLGDRSPAVTVAQLHGIRPDAVRQKQHRVRKRVLALAASEPRFAVLASLPVVA